MSVYDICGNPLASLYDSSGNGLSIAYSVDGDVVFPDGDENPTFKVMTYNCQLWTGRNANETLVRSIFSSTNPTLVGLQECRGVGTGVYVPDVFAYGAMVGTVNNPTAIMSQVPFEDLSATIYSSGGAREYTKCYVTINGKRIAWFNTHLEVSANINVQLNQLDQIFNAISEEETFILTGDFNTNRTKDYGRHLSQFEDAGYNMCNWSQDIGYVDTWFDGTTVEGSTEKHPCDNIITSADLPIIDIEYNTAKFAYTSGAIDHIPIIATIEILES